MPWRTLNSGLTENKSCWFQCALPCEALFSPERVRSKVVFPAPFEPITAAIFPLSTVNETPETARIAP